MAITPWKTSDQLIESVKRKILFPISQSTFTEEDILAFANEEMATSQIPSMLQFHEEYLLTTKEVALIPNQSKYPIPNRAIGLRLRDLYFKDNANDLMEMTRISTGDLDVFDTGADNSNPRHKFRVEGNDVVMIPRVQDSATGTLVFYYYLRPNQLVRDDRAAIIKYFTESITIVNGSIVAGDTVTIEGEVFTAVAGAPGTDEFQIGATSIDTATNLTNAINTNGVVLASNGSPSTSIVTLQFTIRDFEVSVDNSSGFVILDTVGIEFEEIPDNITNGAVIDFLQTQPGHKIYDFDITIPNSGITGSIIEFNSEDVPDDIIVGDYICLAHECIIPQIPSDLHDILAERTAARILAALGDQTSLQASQSKIQEMEANQAKLIDNRTEGAPQKVQGRHTFLKLITRRRNNLRGW